MGRHITISDEDYATLEAVSAQTGASIDDVVRRAIAHYIAEPHTAASRITYSYPTGKRPSSAECEEMERLARKIGAERPALSDMIIEDRGPR